MKTLTLLRHAKSTWDDPVERDFDRPLNGRGRRAAARIGQWLRDEGRGDDGAPFDHVRASPAVRVRQTIEGVEDGLRRRLNPMFDARIYLASAVTLLDIVQGFEESAATALLIGHNPGLEDLLLLVTPDADPLRGEAEIKYPTATLAVLDLDIATWRDAGAGCAHLRHFIRPRDLDASLGPDD
ncbi:MULTISPECIES: SixA phosphatase family protein [Sphingosinicellaceae]|uniref:SixA phosphatase family protein n=1 Tax=Sphingosinicellaceae TaxID=2820280 RepID=UPI001C1E8051|nr:MULTISPECIES: histidine phosphatase family protein [Polymorphobacter]QYE35539.1 histidine phosphatase family protein [Polymorphobacter sp. PAMC 29334]UAJ11148.1 histidine phosphatase family protein [Polymorphobacter megasporae]